MNNSTLNYLNNIKNINCKNNILDIQKNLIVKKIFLKNFNKSNKILWIYYRDRYTINVNNIINKYGYDNIIINYCLFDS